MRRAEWLVERPWRPMLLVVLIITPLLAVGEFSAADTRERVRESEEQSIRSLAQRSAEILATRVTGALDQLAGASTVERLKSTLGVVVRTADGSRDVIDPPDTRELAFQLAGLHALMRSDVDYLLALDGSGTTLTTDPPRAAPPPGADMSGTDYMKALNNREPMYIGVDPVERTPIVAVPLLGERGQTRGALVAFLKSTAMQTWLRSVSDAVAECYLFDRQGRLLAWLNGEQRRILTDLRSEPAVALAMSGKRFVGDGRDPFTEEPALLATWPVGDLGWNVMTLARPEALRPEVEGAIGQQRALRLGLAGVLLLGAGLVGASASQAIRRRREATEALERQTAVSEVLRIISRSPFELDAVFKGVIASAVRLCGADNGSIVRIEEGRSYVAAHAGTVHDRAAMDEYWSTHSIAADRSSLTGRVLLERRSVTIADIYSEPEFVVRDLPGQDPRPNHSVLGVPLLRESEVVGVVILRRREVRPFGRAETALAETFADQAVIAIENVRLFNETKEALERQTATSSILNVISRSPADQQPTLDAIVESGARLCDADMAFIYVVEQGFFKLRAGYKVSPAFVEYTNADPVPVTPHRGSLSGRVVAERRAVQIPDVLADAGYTYLEGQRLVGYRSMLNVPMFSKGELIGLIGLWRTAPVAFTAKQIDLMSTFADQAVIAIENTRLFNETKEALERQTSISDVLQTIGRSAFDLQLVLDTVVERAVKLCDAREGSISTLEADVYRTRAYWSVSSLSPEYIDFMRQEVRTPERGSLIGRTVLEGRVVHIADVLEDAEYTATQMQQAAGYRTLLGVPLLRDGRVIGVFALTRGEVRPFTDRQVELVRTFADQAAIAIENTRLFVATKEALEQQTAVSEVLKTISRSAFDLQPVLDIVLNNAVRLAGADIGWLSRVENEQFMTVAYSAEFPESVREELVRQRAQGHLAGPWVPLGTGGGLMGFTLAEGRTVHLPDVKVDPELKGSVIARLTAARTVVGVPMLRDGRSIGGMVLARYEVRPFGERELELVQTFADQAAIAIENVRLFSETKESLDRQTATSQVLDIISRAGFELAPVFESIVDRVARLCNADAAGIWRRDGTVYRLAAKYGQAPARDEIGATLDPRAPTIQGTVVGKAVEEGRTVHVPDAASDLTLPQWGPATRLAVPIRKDGATVGVLLLVRTKAAAFTPQEIELVESFAAQAAIAIENARLFNEIQDKSRQLEVASRHKSEFLANMSHELRTPLNAIIGFSEVLMHGLFGDVNEKQREYLQDVVGSGQHLLSLINDILDLSKIEAGRMELELSSFSFSDALASGVTIVRERASRHNITLSVVSDELGEVEADERKVKQILYNLLSNAVKFTPDGGRVDVSVRRDNGDVRVEVRDNGIGIAKDDQARIFEEFQQVGRERAREGTGLGLTLTKRFVELHGGRIWLESAPGKGSTFAFTLPLGQAAVVRA